MTNYDHFAPFYDATMNEHHESVPLIQEQISRYSPNAKTILELGCGTGNVLVPLSHNFEVSGIDLSPKMLQIAQQKLPNSALSVGDISNFGLNKKFDVVICIFDTINHLPNFKAWQRTFSLVQQHLQPNGLFIFDMNTTGRMKKLVKLGPLVQHLGDTTVEMTITSAGKDAVDWYITVQAPAADGTIEVYEDTAREQSYPLAQVAEALAPQFELLHTIDSDNQAPTDASDRVYWVTRVR